MRKAGRESGLRHARREALFVLATWCASAVWTVGYCAGHGYGRTPDDLKFVFGFPDWVFWGIVLPWSACLALSLWFSYVFMSDADLGEEGAGAGADGPPVREPNDA